MRPIATVIVLAASTAGAATSGSFDGNLVLYPDNCWNSAARTCYLGEPLTYTDPQGIRWQADEWHDGNGESGTTDGASIPDWAQPIIGDPYDPTYLKAAIVHDHYCYKENHVRSWRATHRMFYHAMRDLGVSIARAKTMYYAVYLAGPRWVKIVPGENCGRNCIKSLIGEGPMIRWEGDRFSDEDVQEEIYRTMRMIEEDEAISLSDLEARAESLEPSDFFFNSGDTYEPSGSNDPNLFPNR